MTVGSKVKQTLAGLKSVESTLRIYSLQSSNDEERTIFSESLKMIEMVSKDMEDRLRTIEFEEPQYKSK